MNRTKFEVEDTSKHNKVQDSDTGTDTEYVHPNNLIVSLINVSECVLLLCIKLNKYLHEQYL